MQIFVKAKTKSRKTFVKKFDATHFTVAVSDPPVDGKANYAIIKSLAEYFHIPLSLIHIVRGEKSKEKVIEVS